MKFAVLLGDGMADLPIPALQGRTPLQAASTSNMDMLAKQGRCGLARTVPEYTPYVPPALSKYLAALR